MLYFWYNLYCLNIVSYVLQGSELKPWIYLGFFFLILCRILGLNFLQKEEIIKKGLNEKGLFLITPINYLMGIQWS